MQSWLHRPQLCWSPWRSAHPLGQALVPASQSRGALLVVLVVPPPVVPPPVVLLPVVLPPVEVLDVVAPVPVAPLGSPSFGSPKPATSSHPATMSVGRKRLSPEA